LEESPAACPDGFARRSRNRSASCAVSVSAVADADRAAQAVDAHVGGTLALSEMQLPAWPVFALGLGFRAGAIADVSGAGLDVEFGIDRLLDKEGKIA